MKKLYLKTFSVLFIGLIGILAYTQGTWIADTIMSEVSASKEIPLGITDLTCMHSGAIPIFRES